MAETRLSKTNITLIGVAAVLAAVLLFTHFRTGPPVPVHTITITWKAAERAEHYNVYRSSRSGGPYTKIGESKTPEYKDDTVSEGNTVYYVVTAVNRGGESKYSEEIKGFVPVPPPPDQKQGSQPKQ